MTEHTQTSSVFLIETYPDGLKAVKAHLSASDIPFEEFGSVHEAINSGCVPNLVTLLANRDGALYEQDIHTLKCHPSFSRVPRISLLSGDMSRMMSRMDSVSGETSMPMPVDKLNFLAVVSKFILRPARRVFQILVSVQPDGGKVKFTGTSLDFSKNGMAFKCISDLSIGQLVIISFVNPKTRKRFLLNAEIVRREYQKIGDTTIYGAVFTRMTGEDEADLTSFITGN